MLRNDWRDVVQRLQHLLTLIDRAGPTRHEREERVAVPLFGDERQRRRDLPRREAPELLGRVGDELAEPTQDISGVRDLEEHRAPVDLGDGMEPELERGRDTEVPTAAAQRPVQILVFVRVRRHRLPVGRHDDRGQQVVARQAHAAGEIADPAAQGEAADAGGGDDAAGRGEPVRRSSRR